MYYLSRKAEDKGVWGKVQSEIAAAVILHLNSCYRN